MNVKLTRFKKKLYYHYFLYEAAKPTFFNIIAIEAWMM